MRILNGNTTTEIYFNAQNNFSAPLTGASGFSVYRSRNGGAASAMSSPTITEISNTNMPGVYSLLVDEDTTLDSDYASQEMSFYISLSGMVPVSKTIELYNDSISQSLLVPPTGVPSATGTLADKVGYLFGALINRVDVTANTKTFYDDVGSSLFSKSISDNGTTYTENEAS